MKRLFFNIIPALLLIFVACEIENTSSVISDAVLIWQGEYEENGCGFTVIIEDIEYKPRNEEFINERFKNSGQTNVTVEYILLNEIIQYYCGGNPNLEERESIDVLTMIER